jgi:hypothetical protein
MVRDSTIKFIGLDVHSKTVSVALPMEDTREKSVIMDITGHKTDEMFYRYNKSDHNEALDAVEKYEQKLVELEDVDQVLNKAKKKPSRRKAENA